MFITYMPPDAEDQEWEFQAGTVKASEAEPVEVSYKKPWDEFLTDLMRGGMRARRHLLWLLLRRAHPTLRYDDVPDIAAGELVVEFDKTEWQLQRDQAVKRGEDEVVLAHIDAELAGAKDGSAEGKALLNRRDRRTESKSRSTSTSPSKTRKR